jgi:hypothetical protein
MHASKGQRLKKQRSYIATLVFLGAAFAILAVITIFTHSEQSFLAQKSNTQKEANTSPIPMTGDYKSEKLALLSDLKMHNALRFVGAHRHPVTDSHVTQGAANLSEADAANSNLDKDAQADLRRIENTIRRWESAFLNPQTANASN